MLPYCFPTIDGKLSLEYSINEKEVIVTVDLQEKILNYSFFDMVNDKNDKNLIFKLFDKDDWNNFLFNLRNNGFTK
jgi:hypothetical protein